MVTFVCEYCDITLKKKQVQGHIRGRCAPGAMICIDCSNTFYGNQHKNHISCISEQEKHWGQFAKTKKTKPISKDPKPETKPAAHREERNKQAQIEVKHQSKNGESNKQINNKVEQRIQQENNNAWRGWKNEIKCLIKENEGKIKKQDLLKKLRKVYKSKQQQQIDEEQFQQIFLEKICKINNISQEIYYTLD